jgi:hypothetical protein
LTLRFRLIFWRRAGDGLAIFLPEVIILKQFFHPVIRPPPPPAEGGTSGDPAMLVHDPEIHLGGLCGPFLTVKSGGDVSPPLDG